MEPQVTPTVLGSTCRDEDYHFTLSIALLEAYNYFGKDALRSVFNSSDTPFLSSFPTNLISNFSNKNSNKFYYVSNQQIYFFRFRFHCRLQSLRYLRQVCTGR